MNNYLFSKSNITLFLIITSVLSVACWNHIRTEKESTHCLQYNIYEERPENEYNRTPINGMPAKHTFKNRLNNLFIVFKSPKDVNSVTIDIEYNDSEDVRIRPFPKPPPHKHLDHYDLTNKGYKVYKTIRDIKKGENFEFIIEGKRGNTIEIIDIKTKIVSTSGHRMNTPLMKRKILLFIIVLVIFFPFYWLFHRNEKISQWLLILFSFSILFYIDHLFAFALICVLSGVYLSKRFLIHPSDSKTFFLALSILFCVFFLAIFKYTPHIYYSIFFTIAGIPLGISFFTFRILQTIMDWYRGQNRDLNFRRFLCYTTFFPTIPAGPIETVNGFFSKRLSKLTSEIFSQACLRVLIGLLKKLVIVDFFLNELIFSTGSSLLNPLLLHPNEITYWHLLICLCSLLLYGYLDLSAYTDIAIGVSLLFGYRIRENFDRPMVSRNIGEFWQSYHISLGSWCRNNIYFPVLMTKRSTLLAIALTFLTMGFWHNLNLNWFIWGAHHSIGVIFIMILGNLIHNHKLHRLVPKVFHQIWIPISICITLFYVSAGMSVVYIGDIETALTAYYRFLTFH